MSGQGDFLNRWSRRKLEGPEADAEADVSDAAAPSIAEGDADAPQDERTDEEVLDELGLKHPDDLEPGDDIKGFMQAAVPDRLRRLALRQLWRGNPVLANLDGLIDYGEDYTDAAMVVENMQTLYQVGKGMLRDLPDEEVEREEIADANTDPDDNEQTAEPRTDEAPPTTNPEPVEADRAPDSVHPGEADEEPSEIPRTRKRMAFRITEN